MVGVGFDTGLSAGQEGVFLLCIVVFISSIFPSLRSGRDGEAGKSRYCQQVGLRPHMIGGRRHEERVQRSKSCETGGSR